MMHEWKFSWQFGFVFSPIPFFVVLALHGAMVELMLNSRVVVVVFCVEL
jgi:hypothetical protein